MLIYLIRHAQTQGNLERRYIGSTDEPLSPAGLAGFCSLAAPAAARVAASPMLRCLQTAQILYPGEKTVICDGLREYDFGTFEGKSQRELAGDPVYQAWIDAGGSLPAPGGETMEAFKSRCCAAFQKELDRAFSEKLPSIAFVVHGGTIMAVLERFAARPFYDWQVGNLEGWFSRTTADVWAERRRLTNLQKIRIGG